MVGLSVIGITVTKRGFVFAHVTVMVILLLSIPFLKWMFPSLYAREENEPDQVSLSFVSKRSGSQFAAAITPKVENSFSSNPSFNGGASDDEPSRSNYAAA
jgi:hypothetical protein